MRVPAEAFRRSQLSGWHGGRVLKGHIDIITDRHVSGWAADEDAPDSVVDVSIFVDDIKVAQVSCDRPRLDLKEARKYGQGLHGFVHEYPEPLPGRAETRVTVRLSETGAVVPNGDVLVADGKARPVLGAFPNGEDLALPVPAPVDPRALFELLQLYDHKLGIFHFLSRLTFGAQDPQQTYFSVFGELMTKPYVTGWRQFYERDHLYELLVSREFQRNVIRLFLRAFPEKRRLIFVHVPKCAGTDLTEHFRTRFPTLDLPLTDRSWTTVDVLFRRLGGLAQHIPFCDTLFVTGHVRLNDYMKNDLIRPRDTVVTIVRDPVAIALSQVNYILTRMEDDFERQQVGTDTDEWCALLDVRLGDWPRLDQGEMARRILKCREIIRPNSMCQWLGGVDAESSLRRLTMIPVEITDTSRYVAWLHERWDIRSETRANRSRTFLRVDDLAAEERDDLYDLYTEDVKLFLAIQKALEVSGGTSIHVPDLRRALSG